MGGGDKCLRVLAGRTLLEHVAARNIRRIETGSPLWICALIAYVPMQASGARNTNR